MLKLQSSLWISVKDKLPSPSIVLVLTGKNKFITIKSCHFIDEYNGFYDGQENITNYVTHWMPLPSLPETEK